MTECSSRPIVCHECWPKRDNWNQPCPCVIANTDQLLARLHEAERICKRYIDAEREANKAWDEQNCPEIIKEWIKEFDAREAAVDALVEAVRKIVANTSSVTEIGVALAAYDAATKEAEHGPQTTNAE